MNYNRNSYKYFCMLLAFTAISCSDSEGWRNDIPLSDDKIAFQATLTDGWNGGGSAGGNTRAAQTARADKSDEPAYLTASLAQGKPLYLHSLESDNKGVKMQGPVTRGKMNETGSVGDEFGVSAVYNNGTSMEEFYSDLDAKKIGDYWFTSTQKTWPVQGSVSFYAYAPYRNSALQWMGGVNSKVIRYTAPVNLSNQPDFIVAKAVDKTLQPNAENVPVDMEFGHALTAITFSTSNEMEAGTVNTITLKGIKYIADYHFNDGSWKNISDKTADFLIPVNKTVQKGQAVSLTDATKALMMVPQDFLDEKATIVMNFTPENSNAQDVIFNLKGVKWGAGKHITYLLSLQRYVQIYPGKVTSARGWYDVWGPFMNRPDLAEYFTSDAPSEQYGVYATDASGKVIAANVGLQSLHRNGQTGELWIRDFTQTGSNNIITFSSLLNGHFFVYSPWQKDLKGAPKIGDKVDVTDATAFFKDAIEYWGDHMLNKNQNTGNAFYDSDLQIGKGEIDFTTGRPTLLFKNTVHAMGLAHIILNDMVYYARRYTTTNNFGNGVKPYVFGPIKSVLPNETCDNGIEPWKNGLREKNMLVHFLYIVKPNAPTTFSATHGALDDWKVDVNPAANTFETYDVLPATKTDIIDYTYHVELGDVFYSDGFLSKPNEVAKYTETNRKPLGVVVYMADNNNGKDYWVETNTVRAGVGGHALVMGFQNAGATGGGVGTTYKWCSQGLGWQVSPKTIFNEQGLLASQYGEEGSGYKTTMQFNNTTTFPIQKFLSDYYKQGLNVNHDVVKTTNWFIPSLGQFYAVLNKVNGGVKFVGSFPQANIVKSDNSANVTSVIDNYLAAPGQPYTPFLVYNNNTNNWALHTNSEYEGETTYRLTYYMGKLQIYHTKYNKTSYSYNVRPFLAF